VEIEHISPASAWLTPVDGDVSVSGTTIAAFTPALPFLRRISDLESMSSVTSMHRAIGVVPLELDSQNALTVFADWRKLRFLLRKGGNGVESFGTA
jgi:hypothetical protein